jgi:hypothetical protein
MDIKDKASEGIREVKGEGKVLKGEKSKDKQYSSSRQFGDEGEARLEFSRAKEKLFDVNRWSDIEAVANSKFELYTMAGEAVKRPRVEVDDYIKIDLPGPLPFYWVKVNEVVEGEDEAYFTVQPSPDPTDRTVNEGKVVTDHFFQEQARSIFKVERHGSQITAMEIGINEAINTQRAEAGEKGLINTLVSEGGWAIFQKYQWKNLTDYLVGLT